MPTLTNGALRIGYEEAGTGPVVALLHGSFANARTWKRVAEPLLQRFRVVAIDLPGYGETSTQPPGEPLSPTFAAECVERVLAHTGAPVVLAGHSFGGVVALAVALRARVPPGALVLFEPVQLGMLATAGDMQAFADAKAVFDDYLRRADAGDPAAAGAVIDFWFGAGTYARMPDTLKARLAEGVAANARDVRSTYATIHDPAALRALEMPVRVVIGDRSPGVTLRIGEAIAGLAPAGALSMLPGADHGLVTTHAPVIATVIGEAAVAVCGTPP